MYVDDFSGEMVVSIGFSSLPSLSSSITIRVIGTKRIAKMNRMKMIIKADKTSCLNEEMLLKTPALCSAATLYNTTRLRGIRVG